MKLVIQNNFITQEEVEIIKSFEMPVINDIENHHIKSVKDATHGTSIMKDFSQTEVSKEVAKFQGDGTLIESNVPSYFEQLGLKIANTIGISSEHMFFQYIIIGAGGRVSKHYDAAKPGYVTYKCNICVEGPQEDTIFVGDEKIKANLLGLYCFEASLYKHWMEISEVPRLMLSYGYLLPYESLNRTENDPRIRLSNRIWKVYMGNK